MIMNDEKFTFFWHGPFSQWHRSYFKLDGVRYSCSEQFMMAQKAVLFGDLESARKIMDTFDPKIMKAVGRGVLGFSHETWEANCMAIVASANIAKFSQNEDLGDLLKATAGTTLVEASPFDRIWGIGLPENDVRAGSRKTWRGENRLGRILTEVRLELFGK